MTTLDVIFQSLSQLAGKKRKELDCIYEKNSYWLRSRFQHINQSYATEYGFHPDIQPLAVDTKRQRIAAYVEPIISIPSPVATKQDQHENDGAAVVHHKKAA